jgi:hypothetical protein
MLINNIEINKIYEGDGYINDNLNCFVFFEKENLSLVYFGFSDELCIGIIERDSERLSGERLLNYYTIYKCNYFSDDDSIDHKLAQNICRKIVANIISNDFINHQQAKKNEVK